DIDSWEAFKNGLSGLFGDRQKNIPEGAEEQLKCRAQRSGEYTVLHTRCIRTCQRKVNPLMKKTKKVSHPNEKVLLRIFIRPYYDERNQRHSKFYQMVQLYRRYEAKRVGRPRFEGFQTSYRLHPLTDETDLVSLIHYRTRKKSID
ncbi:hypothetical protein TNCV_659971, partial [Trichonephila clavipes]